MARCSITVRGLDGGSGGPCGPASRTLRIEIGGDLVVGDVEVVLAGLAHVAERVDVGALVCDVSGVTRVGLHTVDALARLRLGTCRLGCSLVLSHPDRALRTLIHLAGLDAHLLW